MASANVVGLDIGSNQIKAVHLERRRNHWSLANAGIVPTPLEAVQDGVILDIPRVTEAVRLLFKEFRLPAADTIAAVSGSRVLVRMIKIPEMSQSALKKSIRFEAAKHVDQGTTGVSIEESAVEFEVMAKGGQPTQMDVLLVVAPNTMVNGRVSVMEHAGLEPVAIDVEAFALLRSLDAARLLPPPGQAVVVMNMGATFTDLNIVIGNQVAAPRSIPIGGNALTTSVASILNVTPEEAEVHKRSIEVTSAPRQPDWNEPAASAPDPGRQVTVPFVDELIRELRRSVIYFQSQAAEAGVSVNVDHLILAGGGAQLPGLPEYLRERLGMTVSILDPLTMSDGQAPVSAALEGRGSELAVAMGLALKEYE